MLETCSPCFLRTGLKPDEKALYCAYKDGAATTQVTESGIVLTVIRQYEDTDAAALFRTLIVEYGLFKLAVSVY